MESDQRRVLKVLLKVIGLRGSDSLSGFVLFHDFLERLQQWLHWDFLCSRCVQQTNYFGPQEVGSFRPDSPKYIGNQ